MAKAAKKKSPTSPLRRSLYAKIEIGKSALGLDEDTYRDLLAARYDGKRSRKALGTAQLVDLVEHFKSLGFRPAAKRRGGPQGGQGTHKGTPARAGGRKLADGREARKIRALWLSLYHLGVVRDPSEKALSAFVKRLSGVDDMRWLDGAGAFRAIEALKDWAARDGHVNWEPYATTNGPIHHPRGRVLEAQWRRLHRLGLVRIPDTAALSGWLDRFLRSPNRSSHLDAEPAGLDRAIEELGGRIRKAMEERGKPSC